MLKADKEEKILGGKVLVLFFLFVWLYLSILFFWFWLQEWCSSTDSSPL